MKYLPFAFSTVALLIRPLLCFLFVFDDETIGVFHSSNTSNASCSPGRGGCHVRLTSIVPRFLSGRSTTFQSTRSPPGYVTMPFDLPSPLSSLISLAPFGLPSAPVAASCATLWAHEETTRSPAQGPTNFPTSISS